MINIKLQRTKNTARNIVWGTLEKGLGLLLPFFSRTVLLKILAAEYLGIGSLFTSILQVLNLAELGFSSAIIFSMYKPISENDKDAICALLELYKKVYRIIGIVVLSIGIIIMPFLRNLITGTIPQNVNLYLVYGVFLLNTVISYFFFAYRTSLLNAHQRNDITSKIAAVMNILKNLFQIYLLVMFKNYYCFLVVIPIITIIQNSFCAYISRKKYPQYVCRGKISIEERRVLKEKIKGLVIIKLAQVSRNAFDNIFISAFVGLSAVAVYGNYYYIMSACQGMLLVFTISMSAGIGNSVATENLDKNYGDMMKFIFMYSWVSGFVAICLICLYQDFMHLWVGRGLMLDFSCVILLGLYFYLLTLGDIRSLYVEANGLWNETKHVFIIESIMNLCLNFVFVMLWGIFGVILATVLSRFLIGFVLSPPLIYKYYFKTKKAKDIYLRHLADGAAALIACLIAYAVCSLISGYGILILFCKAFTCTVIVNLIFLLAFRKTTVFKESVRLLNSIIAKKTGGANGR